MIPASEFHLRTCQCVVAIDDGGIERRNKCRVEKIEKVGDRWPKPFDLYLINGANALDHIIGIVAAAAMIEQPPECTLVVVVFVNIGDAQLWLPKECMVRAFEDLALFGDRMDHSFKRRAAISDPKRPGFDFGHDLLDPAPDRTKILDPLFPQEPAFIRCPGVLPPSTDQLSDQFGTFGQTSFLFQVLSMPPTQFLGPA